MASRRRKPPTSDVSLDEILMEAGLEPHLARLLSRMPHRLAQVYRLQMCSVFSGLFLAYMIAPSLFGWFGLAPVIMAAGALTFATGLVGLFLVLARRSQAAAIRP